MNDNNTRRYNLFELRRENLGAVTNAIQILRHAGPEWAKGNAEAFITTAFHNAAVEATYNFGWENLKWTCAAIGYSALTAVSLHNLLNHPEAWWLWGPIAALQAGGTVLAARLRSNAKNDAEDLMRQADLRYGYEPSPEAIGDSSVYKNAKQHIDRLLVKARLQTSDTAMHG